MNKIKNIGRHKRATIEGDAWDYLQAFTPRLAILAERAEKLSSFAHAYEEATPDPTPEQEARLDRIIGLSNRAHEQHDDLAERASIVKKILILWEDEDLIHIKVQQRNTRARNLRKQVRGQPSNV